ncbi:hypothetical protein FSP39_007061 [Pinctada imbricata]|uniref:Uncharacterized protein n=1 Tax=Pinctada imbricata TaxID=66713 RepID=A0AA88XS13_PINIB|nr:hypothetical protein FSP39_007061 [Pinctada imbricata]
MKAGGMEEFHCFAEERSLERAAKRMAEMKKRSEEDSKRDMAFFCDMEDSLVPRPVMSMKLQRAITNDELQHRLQVALHEGTPNIAQTLVGLNGLNVRTSYTHAGMVIHLSSDSELPEAVIAGFPKRVITLQQQRTFTPPSLRRNIPISLVEGVPTIAETLARIRPNDPFFTSWTRDWISNTTFHASNTDSFRDLAPSSLPVTMPPVRDISSEENSDSDELTTAAITLAARSNPYNQQLESTNSNYQLASLSSTPSILQKRHISRSGPVLKSMSRRLSTSSTPSSPFLPNAMVPINPDDVGKIEKRSSAIGRSPGPLTIYGEETVPKVVNASFYE